MNVLPEDADFEFFVGRELEGITFGRWQTIFAFDAGVQLSVESDFGVTSADGFARFSDPLLAAQDLVQFIGTAITAVHTNAERTLTLQWGTGRTLAVFNSSEHHESYQVHNGDIVWVV